MGFWNDLGNAANDAANGDLGDAANDLGDAANDAGNDIENAASDGEQDAENAVQTVEDVAGSATDTAVHAVDQLIGQAKDAGKQLVDNAEHTVDHVVHDAGKAAGDVVDAIGDAAKHPLQTAEDAADAAGKFVSEHSGDIIGGLELAGSIALYASGAGAPLAAAISGGMATANDLGNGKDLGDALLDGAATAADKLIPGAGSATYAVVEGIEHGESAGQIAREAGLNGVGATGGPLLGYGATLADDISHGKSAEQTGLDLATQYGNDASGAGTDHSNPLGQIVVAGANDAANGDSIEQFGLDVAKIYAHDAAGGSASPTGQLTDTFFDDIKDGKSLDQTLDDMYHQAVQMGERVEHDDPGAVAGAIGGSDVPGSHYAETAAGDLLDGKSLEQTATDVGKDAAGDVVQEIGSSDEAKDLGGDIGEGWPNLDPLKPYAETALNDALDGKSLDQIAADVGKQAAGDALNAGLHDLGGTDTGNTDGTNGTGEGYLDPLKPYAETALNDVVNGKSVDQIAADVGQQMTGGDAKETVGDIGGGPGIPQPDPLSDYSSINPDTANMVLKMLGADTDGSGSTSHPSDWSTSLVSESHAVYYNTIVSSGDVVLTDHLAAALDHEPITISHPMFVSTEPTPIALETLVGGVHIGIHI